MLLLSSLIVLYGLAGGVMEQVTASKATKSNDVYEDLSIFTEVLNRVRNDYVDSPDLDRALKGALHGMMEALDPYSSFVDAQTFQSLADQSDAAASAGMVLSKRYGYAYVVAVHPSSPASREGLRSGDLIESIEGELTTQMSIWEAQHRMNGPAGSTLEVRVIRSRRSEPQRLSLKRQILEPQGVTARLLEEEIGLLRIRGFGEGAALQVKARLKMLESSSVKGLLIDVRGAAEGSVAEAVAVADLFLDRNAIVATSRGRDGSEKEFHSKNDAIVKGLPLALLVDGGSSGPAEILAAALQDVAGAQIIGLRSNGMGSERQAFALADGSQLFISTRSYYRPSGVAIQMSDLRKSGIRPDVRTPTPEWVNQFYYDNTPENGDGKLSEEFYRSIDEEIEKIQLNEGIQTLKKQITEATRAHKAA